MTGGGPNSSLLGTIWQAAVVVLLTAVAVRVAWEVISPLVPGLLAISLLVLVISLALRGRRP